MTLKPDVSIVKGINVPKMVEKAVELVGGITDIVNKNSKVVIKPNLMMATVAKGVCTSSKVVESIVELIKKAEPKEIVIADSSMVNFDTEEAFKVSGLLNVANKTGVKWLDLKKDKIVEVPVPEGKLLKSIKLFKTAAECDVLINLPVMKTHVQCGVTLGLKNLKGLMPDEEKKRFHFTNLHQCIPDLNSIVKPKLTIVDGTTALEGIGPESPPGKPVAMNVITAGRDPVAVDSVTAKIMGFDWKEIRHLRNAAIRGLGTAKIEEIEIKGQPIDQVARVFERAPQELTSIPGIKMIVGSPCSSGIAEFMYAMILLEKYKLAPKIKDLTIAIGPKAKIPKEVKGKLLLLGKCLERHKDKGEFAQGCPPFIFDSIAKLYGLNDLTYYLKQEQ
jgi:uncharacterized protein (DUF362 family)